MDLKEVMDTIRDTFDEEVFADLNNFCGDSFAEIRGKDEFFSRLENKLSVLIDNENEDLASIGIIRGDDAKRFLDRMEKVDREFKERKKKNENR